MYRFRPYHPFRLPAADPEIAAHSGSLGNDLGQGLFQVPQGFYIFILGQGEESDLNRGQAKVRDVENPEFAGGDMYLKRHPRHDDQKIHVQGQGNQRIRIGRHLDRRRRGRKAAIPQAGVEREDIIDDPR
jgi:hypothetical protein